MAKPDPPSTGITLVADDWASLNAGKDFEGMLQELASKKMELHGLSDAQWLDIIDEMLDNLRQREQEWTHVNHWLMEEPCVLKQCSDEFKCEILRSGNGAGVDADSTPMPNHVHYFASNSRLCLVSTIPAILGTLRSVFLHRQAQKEGEAGDGDDSRIPDFLKASRKMDTTINGSYTVYGPKAVHYVMNHSFEVWSKDNEASGKLTIPEGVMQPDDFRVDGPMDGFNVVLGAGNQVNLSAVDTLQMLFMRKEPVLIKHHPLRPHLIAPFQIIFEPLIKRGYVRQIKDRGVTFTTDRILNSPLLCHIHITGAYSTVLQLEKELAKTRPSKDKKAIQDMISSELGCASPFIVMPGTYTKAELNHAVTLFLTSRLVNGGSNCLSSQILVLPKAWPQKQEMRSMLLEKSKTMPKDPTYYPGSLQKRQHLVASYKKAGRATVIHSNMRFEPDKELCKEFSKLEAGDDLVIVECGTPGEDGFNNEALANESFSALIAIVELPGGGPDCDDGKVGGEDKTEEYMLNTVVPFVNDKSMVFGTLVCCLMHPSTTKFPKEVVAALRYGSVCVNAASVFGYLPLVNGGAWGGHTLDSLGQSGRGRVGNLYSIPRMEKTVVRNTKGLKGPIMADQSSLPPPIAFDVFNAIALSETTAKAVIRVVKLLVIRLVQAIAPKVVLKKLFGQGATTPYGGPL